jgi:hypothetical protein
MEMVQKKEEKWQLTFHQLRQTDKHIQKQVSLGHIPRQKLRGMLRAHQEGESPQVKLLLWQ